MDIPRRLLRFSLALTIGVAPVLAPAQVFKCRGPDGSLSFSDRPCPKDASGEYVEVRPNVIDNSGLRRQGSRLRQEEAASRYPAARSESTSAEPHPATSQACEQARRSYEIEQKSLKRTKGSVQGKRESMYAACGQTPPPPEPRSAPSSAVSGTPTAPTQLIDPHTGKVMPRTGSGYTDPATGTYYQDTGAGVVNTRTGEFTPTH